jgi:glutathione S-transferase
MKFHGLAFEERRVALYRSDSKEKLLSYTPSGKVPVLIDGAVHLWESMAILEYLAEKHPHTHGWPQDTHERALARSISAEMHAGFGSLRQELPMNLRRKRRTAAWSNEAGADIERVVAIWEDCRARSRGLGEFLFGAFGVADAMYAPVAFRFHLYEVGLPPAARAYCDTLLGLPAMRTWLEEALRETEVIAQFESHSD